MSVVVTVGYRGHPGHWGKSHNVTVLQQLSAGRVRGRSLCGNEGLFKTLARDHPVECKRCLSKMAQGAIT